MARTESTMLELGTALPAFASVDVRSGERVTESSVPDGRACVVMFLCNHCPFVKHLHEGLTAFDRDYASKEVELIAISSNDIANYPDDAPEKMKELADSLGWSMRYCYDESQEAAKAFRAACTPDFFVFGSDRALAYRGQFDASRPDSGIAVTGEDVRAAVDAVLVGAPPSAEQKPSLGCNIKWKAGNEPAYVAAV